MSKAYTWSELTVFFLCLLAAGLIIYPSHYHLGLMQSRNPDRSIAIAQFKKYLSRHPYHKGATKALVAAYESVNRPERAVGPLLSLYRHRKGDSEVGRDIIRLFERAGRFQEAEKFRWRLYQDLKDRPGTDPLFLEYLVYRAYKNAQVSQDEDGEIKALQVLAGLAKGHGYSQQLDLIARSSVPFKRAQPGPGSGLSILERLRRAAADRPRDKQARWDLVYFFHDRKRYEKTAEELRRFIALFKDDGEAYGLLAYVDEKRGRKFDAIGPLDDYISRHPEDLERTHLLANLLARKSKEEIP